MNKGNGNMLEFGPVQKQAAPKKEQAVIVTIPPEVKKYLNLLVMSNSLIWVIAGLCTLREEPLPTWGIITMSILIFWCVAIIPFFVNFINKINWGQRGG